MGAVIKKLSLDKGRRVGAKNVYKISLKSAVQNAIIGDGNAISEEPSGFGAACSVWTASKYVIWPRVASRYAVWRAL